jgi:hypothetical protein
MRFLKLDILAAYSRILYFTEMPYLIRPKNPRPLGGVRVIWLCLKNAFEIAVAKP